MFNIDTYKTMTKDQLKEKVMDIEERIKMRDSMSKAARLDNLFMPLEVQLQCVKNELSERS